jgi:hypothetical protein
MASDSPAAAPTVFEELPTYAFKPSLMGSMHAYRLAPDALEWQIGRHAGRVPYRAISRVRLSFRPVTMASRRFLTEIWSPNTPKLQIASTSWRSMVEMTRQDAEYAAFIEALHQRLREAGSKAPLTTGSPPWLYWAGVVLFSAVALALALLAMRSLQAGSTIGATFVLAFLAFSLWQIGDFFRRNRPGTYSAGAVPPQVLPG